ncbi:hypothetical protein [Kribbella solani]|uniref:Uncharacterized protein n=1 Tax=Kribbella solani TaxID=236067 RepID=A0A841DWE8_9ACTN|nr:hypothetical protein [Kribbella solani]MBB5982301.1 hypothetical protein [Kribbella solani]
MSPEPEEYAGLLKALRETPDQSPAGVSIDRAMRDGRRTVRRRRVLGGAAVVALIAAVSATPMVLHAVRADRVQPAAPGQVVPFGIWSRAFDVGSAGGFTPRLYTSANRWQSVKLVAADNSGLAPGATAVATMYAPGAWPGVTGERRLDDIDGRPVYLLARDHGGVRIAFRYSDTGWATVQDTGTDATPERARHVAEGIQLRAKPAPVTVPFSFGRSAVESDEVVAVAEPHGSPVSPESYSVLLGDADPVDPGAIGSLTTVGVVRPAPSVKPTMTIGGHPATSGGSDVTVFLGESWAGTVWSISKSPTAIAATIKLRPDAPVNDPIR